MYGRTYYKKMTCLEYWVNKLQNSDYSDFLTPLEINQFNHLLLIRYGALQDLEEGIWTKRNNIYRECRSIVIHSVKNEIVLCPFKKFFNLNELEETSYEKVKEKIKISKVFEITDKIDGSMQSARFYNGQIIMSGSRALDPKESWRLADGYSKLTENHKKLIKDYPHMTFVFEYVSLKDAHIVKYTNEQEGLYLIGMRNVSDGSTYSYQQIQKIANIYKIPTTRVEELTITELFQQMKTHKSCDKEGWVINLDGELIKIKCDDYISLHKLLDFVSSQNVIIKNIADGTFDDLISKIPEEHIYRIMEIANQVKDYEKYYVEKIKFFMSQIPFTTRKEDMQWINQNVPKKFIGYLIEEYLGREWSPLYKFNLPSRKYVKYEEIQNTLKEQED